MTMPLRKLMFALALSCSISVPLAGCASLGTTTENPLTHSTVDEKALYVAEAAFKGVDAAINEGIDQGVINSGNAAQVQSLFKDAKLALDKARATHALADSLDVQILATKIFGLLHK